MLVLVFVYGCVALAILSYSCISILLSTRHDSYSCFCAFLNRIRLLCGCPQIRQVELQFTVGEALSCAGAGRASEVARDPWAVEQLQNSDCEEVKGTMQELIDMIIKKYATSTAPYVRQVSKIVLSKLIVLFVVLFFIVAKIKPAKKFEMSCL